MDADKRRLVRQLFAIATMIASEAEEIAIAGQSPSLSTRDSRAKADNILRRSEELADVARTVKAIFNLR